MIKRLKIFFIWFSVAAVLINSVITCMCYDTLYGSVNVPSQVAKNKSFTLNLQVQCNNAIGVVMFTLVHGNEIEYKDCKVNDRSCGYIENSYNDNTLSIIYINTQGIMVTETTNLIDITFEAKDIVTNTEVQIYTSYGTSADENTLVSDNGRVYTVGIVENVTNKQPADGIKLENRSASTSNGHSSASNKEIPDNKTETIETLATDETTTVSNNINAARSSGVNLFFTGTIFAIAVVIVIFISYKTGKKNSDKNK